MFRTGGTNLGEGLTPYLAPPADTAPIHSRRGCALGSPPHNAHRASAVCRSLGQLARCSRGAGLPAQSLEHLYLGVRWMQHLEPKLPFPFPTTTDLTPLHTYTHLDPIHSPGSPKPHRMPGVSTNTWAHTPRSSLTFTRTPSLCIYQEPPPSHSPRAASLPYT